MKTKYKTGYKHIIVAIIIFFGLIAIVSSVSACANAAPIPTYELDDGHKTFNINDNKCYTSWNAYRHSQGKNDKIMAYNEYKLKNKKGKIISKANIYYDIEKVKKNRIKVTTTYSIEPNIEKVKIYKTKLSVRAFYWKYIEIQFTKKVDKKAFYKEIAIDKGKLEATLPFDNPYKNVNTENQSDKLKINFYSVFENVTSVKHSITWETVKYTTFPNILFVKQEYTDTAPKIQVKQIGDGGTGYYYSPYITLEKTKKNQIKITIQDVYKINGDFVKDRTYFVKTNLSLKDYYFKIFKPKMVKMFY